MSVLSKEEYLTVKEAAGILRISQDFMRDIVRGRRGKNKPPALKIGTIYRLPIDDFNEWRKKRKA